MSSYFDPPETHEPPECCGDPMNVPDDGTCVCETCGETVEVKPDIEPVLDFCSTCQTDYPCKCEAMTPETPENCPHGNAWGECDQCDHEGDLAYDAARERGCR